MRDTDLSERLDPVYSEYFLLSFQPGCTGVKCHKQCLGSDDPLSKPQTTDYSMAQIPETILVPAWNMNFPRNVIFSLMGMQHVSIFMGYGILI